MVRPVLSLDTNITVCRTVKTFHETFNHGPKTIRQAIADGDLTTSSGTVSVKLEVVDGEHAGATPYLDSDGVWRAFFQHVSA